MSGIEHFKLCVCILPEITAFKGALSSNTLELIFNKDDNDDYCDDQGDKQTRKQKNLPLKIRKTVGWLNTNMQDEHNKKR